ncbi:ABC transporter permease [Mycolicibacterium sp. BiH015]|uniref:methionine ABC transporter permease n=1 Tax=Mycolicibacterium sp. BiH015 TaxID=3018808 RepID=UPI0022E1F1DD|nr:methionine ABC transporter permease [Mycolicibacterium sp. BiH015]MDA2890197.1 ABC transporter permease [Mycolicibacterium sp. BiH015]
MSFADSFTAWLEDSILLKTDALLVALNQTLQLVFVPFVFVVLFGIPLGVILYVTSPGGLSPVRWLNSTLGVVVNVTRSLPFLVLVIALWPLGRLLVGSSLGTVAAMVPLAIGTIPFFARLVEASLREVDSGKIDAARVVGATRWQIITKTLLPESISGIIAGLTITIIALLGFSALAGVIGGGGLGDLAIRYGARSYDGPVLWSTVLLLILLAQIFQVVGDYFARRTDHRARRGGGDDAVEVDAADRLSA